MPAPAGLTLGVILLPQPLSVRITESSVDNHIFVHRPCCGLEISHHHHPKRSYVEVLTLKWLDLKIKTSKEVIKIVQSPKSRVQIQ